MIRSAQVYVNKRRFVDLLSEAYELDGEVTRISYTRDPETELEVVEIKYSGGGVDCINVTANSNTATAREIANQISGIGAAGLMR